MKLLQVAEQNKKYYTKDFILGFNTGAKAQYEADKKEVRHGRWMQVGDVTYRCSVCGEISCCNSPFCSECGAKMNEVERNEN